MVEQNTIAGIHVISFPEVNCDPVGIELGGTCNDKTDNNLFKQ